MTRSEATSVEVVFESEDVVVYPTQKTRLTDQTNALLAQKNED
jgi:hypothetical protein